MHQLEVGLGERSYPIWVGEQILPNISTALADVNFPAKVAVVTNTTVADQYCEQVVESLVAGGRQVSVIRLPDGEEYKTLSTLENIYDVLIEQKFDRFSGLVALGGGVVGDMVGFAAATFLRGIPFIQIPTTLLAQVDSSVGGKTAVNHPQGKNLIGAFYQPQHVHIDVAVLSTLPKREFAAGMAEVIKYGVIRDAEFFHWLHASRQALAEQSSDALIYAVMKSCQIKANVVENDEKEQGVRALLNYGHTFGHAVETLCGYGVVKHGEAVSIGMVMAARAAQMQGYCSQAEVDSLRELLAFFDLPVTPPNFTVTDYSKVMLRDKKVKSGAVRVVLNHGLGAADLHQLDNLDEVLHELLA